MPEPTERECIHYDDADHQPSGFSLTTLAGRIGEPQCSPIRQLRRSGVLLARRRAIRALFWPARGRLYPLTAIRPTGGDGPPELRPRRLGAARRLDWSRT